MIAGHEHKQFLVGVINYLVKNCVIHFTYLLMHSQTLHLTILLFCSTVYVFITRMSHFTFYFLKVLNLLSLLIVQGK